MKYVHRAGFLTLILLICLSAFSAETTFRVKGESLTPFGTRMSLEWKVKRVEDSYTFLLNNREKAEMILKAGKVVKIRRRVRYAGKEKWIVLTDPLQIRLELKSGFYPFAAVLNYSKNGSRETILSTGRFEVVRSTVK
ncbi:MAG: hypothetical protein DRJ14_00335 [Acidobacteria bacterium]|nr:MAG: hypothetical protein DRJ14_00335 [Acidobacteriota bacterium]